MTKIIITEPIESMSAKEYLKKYHGVSLTLWRKIKAAQSFHLNGRSANPALIAVATGDTLEYELIYTANVIPAAAPLAIAYEDDFLLIADKPAGQLVHPTTRQHSETLANAVLYHLRQQGLPAIFHPVHRLDKNTSGLVLIAKQPNIQNLLSQQNHRQLQRVYAAVVHGVPQPATGSIDLPIKRTPDSIIKRQTSPDGQAALTYYSTIAEFNAAALLKVTLATGRTHQIRVHCAAIGHPLIGDDLYGQPSPLLSRQALHACSIEFSHPITKKTIAVSATLPDDLRALLAALKRRLPQTNL